MEALMHTLIFSARQVILSVSRQTMFRTAERHLLLVLAARVVILQTLIKDLFKFTHLSSLYILLNFAIESFLADVVARLGLHVLAKLVQNAFCVHGKLFWKK